MWTPPWLASTISNEERHVGQVPSYARPLDAAFLGCGPVWFFVRSDPYRLRIRQITWVSDKYLQRPANPKMASEAAWTDDGW